VKKKERQQKRQKLQQSVEVDVLKNQLARALADYDNLTKRVEKEREIIDKLASIKIVARLLPVYDALVSAQNHLKDSGLAITIGQFEDILKEEGIEKIPAAVGDKFDHNLHEAVEAVSSPKGAENGTIAEIVLGGWMVSDGPVIRHTKVKVYGEASKKEKELEKEMARGDYM